MNIFFNKMDLNIHPFKQEKRVQSKTQPSNNLA